MADTEDMDALARRYIALWQEQLAQVSSDPSAMEAWRPVFEGAAKSLGWTPDAVDAYATALSGAVQNTARSGGEARDAAQGETTAARAKASAAPSDGGGAGYADVLRRLDTLEQRLAALESNSSSARRKPGKAKQKKITATGAKKKPKKDKKKRTT